VKTKIINKQKETNTNNGKTEKQANKQGKRERRNRSTEVQTSNNDVRISTYA
jgi:hypothetical protein